VERPQEWLDWVNQPQTPAEEAALRQSLRRGRPFGTEFWQRQTVERFVLQFTLRPPHRPRQADATAADAGGRP
jgi:hypothetical protein